MILFSFFTLPAYAAFNTATLASTTITVGGYNLVLRGQVEAVSVRNTDFDVRLSSGSSLTIISSSRKDMNVSTVGTAPFVKSCNANDSSLVFSTATTTSTSTISIIGNCSGASAPAQITNLTATVGSTQITLNWSIPNSGGSAIIDYVVEYKKVASSTYTLFADGVSIQNSAVVTGLTNDLAYQFRVYAINSVGNALTSASISSTPTQGMVSGGGGGGGSSGGGSGGGGGVYIVPPIVTPLVLVGTTTAAIISYQNTPQNTPVITSFLFKGKKGKEILALQNILKQESLYTGSKTEDVGYFGIKTEKALKDFQCKYKIVCALPSAKTGWGFTGSKTRDALNNIANKTVQPVEPIAIATTTNSSFPALAMFPRVLYKGLSGKDVILLQKYLTQFGFGKITDKSGYFGLSTEKAVHTFQVKYGISTGKTTKGGYGVFGKESKILFVNTFGK